MEKHEIVFENLHGNPDMDEVVVDLDIEDSAKGITRVADDEKERKPRGAENGRDREAEGEDLEEDLDRERRPLNANEEPDEEEDDEKYSKNVRKRIERERKLRLKDKADAQYWRDQAEEAQRQLSEVRKGSTKEALEAIDSQISAVESELEAAIEAGKSGDQVKLTGRLTDLKAKRITTEIDGRADPASDNADGRGRVRPSGGANPLAKEWMSEQSDWYGKPGFERQSRMANRIDSELAAEGYDVRTPEYFDELTRRVRKQAPELFTDRDDDRDADRGRGRTRSPVAPVDRGGNERPAGRSSRVELGREDFANMRHFGLDPNNPSHLKEYATNKREADQQERQRREGGRS